MTAGGDIVAVFPQALIHPTACARGESGLHRYFFAIRRDGEEYPDTTGTLLLSEEPAHAYALRIIRELKEAGGHDNLCAHDDRQKRRRKSRLSWPFIT